MTKKPHATDNAENKPDNHQTGSDHPPDEGSAVFNVIQTVVDAPQSDQNASKQYRDGYDRANLVFMGLTFFAALAAAIFTGRLAWLTDDLARDSAATLDASNRAYIAMTGVEWDGIPEVGKNQRIKILFKNVGKEAASNFSLFVSVSNQFDFEPDSKGMPYVPSDKVTWPNIECSGVNLPGERAIGQRPVYPDVPNEAIWYAFNPGGSTPGAVFVPQRLLDGKTTIWVAGCAIYRSLNKWRHSPFCFYYQPARGGRIEEGTFEWCPVGTGNAD